MVPVLGLRCGSSSSRLTSARPWQSCVKVVDPEKQENAVARLGVVGTCQRGMLVGAPFVETEQDRSIGVDDLPEVVMGRNGLWQAKQRLIPFEALGYVSHADDRPCALHRLLCGLAAILLCQTLMVRRRECAVSNHEARTSASSFETPLARLLRMRGDGGL